MPFNRKGLHGAVGFLPGDEVDASMLEAGPGGVVDAGFVPEVDDFFTFPGLIAQGFYRGSLDDGGVVFFLFAIGRAA
ncbi:hypothetical protein JIN85_04655 [Luteolibacter pohnpeiensis]|uniref:Uncharacterized protein n=1 Tax=Luteolibacter pohnpeiensis TaxID=454153 RepID=A0A934VQ36_9BACT|nr:hypothetical protein [Luteolibacter pohnpeiensis]MBK1881691.1 hypothetical protein [Luteolibacter pohnpeiensis]